MTCSVCGRKLRNPQSMELGYGPVCYMKAFGARPKMKARAAQETPSSFSGYDIPGQISIEEYLNGIA